MSSLLRSSPWSSMELPRADDARRASTSLPVLEWCGAAARTSQWTLATCDARSLQARFVVERASPDESARWEQRSIQCHVAVGREAVSATASAQRETVASLLDPEVVFPSVLALAFIFYVLYTLRHVRQRAPPASTSKLSRCAAVDVFRGLTICLMVFVNYGGGGFRLFLHSAWDGLTVADVVFPCFAWIMGFTMSLGAARGRPAPPWSRVLTRAAKLFALGIFLNNGASWADWRIPGVLQSLSAGYLLTACLTRAVGHGVSRHLPRDRSPLVAVTAHIVLGIVPLVALNLALTFGLRVPGCPTGYLGPGGDSDGGRFRNCTGGAHLFVDRMVFGHRHIYQTPTCQPVFHTGPFDPEGLLNWLMVASTAYGGFLAGTLFQSNTTPRAQRRASLLQAAVCLFASACVTGGMGALPHAVWIPLNKNLWSLSYVLASVAVAHLVFALLLFFGAGQPTASAWLPWTTWSHVGQNSIFIYVMHEILQSYAPFSPRPLGGAEVTPIPHIVVLLSNVAGVLWWILIAEWMHARGIFLAV